MSRQKTKIYVELTPKTNEGKLGMGCYGERWILKEQKQSLKFVRDPGPWLVLFSIDEKKCLIVNKNNDKNYSARIL